MGPRYIGDKKILPKKCTKTVLGLCRRKDKISSKVNSNLVAGNVFDLQNEFYDNRTWFGTIGEKMLLNVFFGNFWTFLRSSLFRSQNIRQEVWVWSGNLPSTLFCMRNPKKWSRDDLLTPQISNLGGFCWNRLLKELH